MSDKDNEPEVEEENHDGIPWYKNTHLIGLMLIVIIAGALGAEMTGHEISGELMGIINIAIGSLATWGGTCLAIQKGYLIPADPPSDADDPNIQVLISGPKSIVKELIGQDDKELR